MRLLHTEGPGLKLRDFQGDVTEPYAIFSHTWGDDEVLFADVDNPDVHLKGGYQKIANAIRQAKDDRYNYLWVDTCCIDKKSSAELSEAINSMFYWYQNAAVCYAFLANVTDRASLASSLWFERGWTLQELLAPKIVRFYTAEWVCIGDKNSLSGDIEKITGIKWRFLSKSAPLSDASIAERMSWASKRHTSRIEDTAYCLMGIFSVNMTCIYGEREQAFVRLQKEIMEKNSEDQSLFAWADPNAPAEELRGLLAESPHYFAGSAGIIPLYDLEARESGRMINNRLKIGVRFAKANLDGGGIETSLAMLCCMRAGNGQQLIGIYLKQVSKARDEYKRIHCSLFDEMSNRAASLELIYVPQVDLGSIRKRPYISQKRVFLRHCLLYGKNGSIRVLDSTYIKFCDAGYGLLSTLQCQDAIRHAERWMPLDRLNHFPCACSPGAFAFMLQFRIVKNDDIFDIMLELGMTDDLRLGFKAIIRSHNGNEEFNLRKMPFTGDGPLLLKFDEAWGSKHCMIEVNCIHNLYLRPEPHYIVDISFKFRSRRTDDGTF